MNRSLSTSLLLTILISFPLAAKQKEHKGYPESGTVVSFRTVVEQEVSGVGGVVVTENVNHRVYRVETATMIYEFTGGESSSKQHQKPTMLIGEKIQFRVEGTVAYIPIVDGKEHRVTVVSAEPKK